MKMYLYHIGLSDDLNDGYVGITVNPKDRFKSHKSPSKPTILSEMIAKHDISFKDMRILCFGPSEKIKQLERFLRPEMHIGWNVAVGGGGANNVGEEAYNYNPDAHSECLDCGKHISSKNIRCYPCFNARRLDLADKEKRCTKCNTPVYGRNSRCQKCMGIDYMNNPHCEVEEPYHIINNDTGERIIVKNMSMFIRDNGLPHKARTRFSEMRQTIRNGNYGIRRGIEQRRFKYKNFSIDESPYGFTIKVKTIKWICGEYGSFDTLEEAANAIGVSQSTVQNRCKGWLVNDWVGWSVEENYIEK